MANNRINKVVRAIKIGYLICNFFKYGGAIALGFTSARLYRCCIVENPNYIAIAYCIAIIFFCIAITILSFRCRQSIIKCIEERLNDNVLKQADISYRLSNIDENDCIQKQHLKQEETLLNEEYRKLLSTLP